MCKFERGSKMNTSSKITTADKWAGKSASEFNNAKVLLTHFSKSNVVMVHSAAACLINSKTKPQRNINWHESEWPDLPKPVVSSSECDCKLQEIKLLQGGSCSSQCEILSKEGDENLDETEAARESCDRKHCLQKKQISQKYKTDSLYKMQKNFTCPTRGVDDITLSLTALKMSNKHNQFSAVANLESSNLRPSCLKNRPSQNERKGKKAKGNFVENHSSFKLNQEAFSNSKEEEKICKLVSLLSDDDFPDLSTSTRKKKLYSPVQDPSAKKLLKKYPKSNDPILINLGEVLEHSSSIEKPKSLLRNRTENERARAHTSRRVVKRGKQREFPKRKPLTKLKLAILRDRQQRLKSRSLTNSSSKGSGSGTDLISFYKECECVTSKQEETSVGFKGCCGSCSLQSLVSKVDIQNRSESGETDYVVLKSEKKEVCSNNQNCISFTENNLNSISCADDILQIAKSSIHSRKFREYCNNDKYATLEDKVKTFVKQIYRFQTNSHLRDAEKARIHRRYVLGLREADKYFKLRKLKVLIIATDLEANSEKGGLDEIIENMKSRGNKENVPVIFALRRRDLAYCVYRKVPVSCMAVLNFEGAEEVFGAMIDAWREASAAYKKLKEATVMSSKEITVPECKENEKLATM